MKRMLIVIGVLGWSGVVYAQQVDFATLPTRASVQLTIYNGEDLTLVRETRPIMFKKGDNQLQFSWANTLIDPSSVELSFKSHAEELELMDSTFPYDRPQTVYWSIESEMEGEATVEILYFTSGLSWSADYVVIANPDESKLQIESFIHVFNQSGENYENAQIRLVVGTVNLVEKIAQLANLPMGQVEAMRSADDEELKMEYKKSRANAAKQVMDCPTADTITVEIGMKNVPKEIIKEGLSEYFIYTIEGRETIPSGWSKRMRNFSAGNVDVKIQYRYRPLEYGDFFVKMYLLRNNQEQNLGSTPLPDGTVRIFRDNGREGLSYLAQQYIKYVPIGEMMELNLGQNKNVSLEAVQLAHWRDHFWFQRSGVNVYYSPTQRHEIKINDRVVGWQDHERRAERIRNYTDKPIDVEIRRSWEGQVDFVSQLNPAAYDFRTPELRATVHPMEVKDINYHLVRYQGILQKQNQVTLKNGE